MGGDTGLVLLPEAEPRWRLDDRDDGDDSDTAPRDLDIWSPAPGARDLPGNGQIFRVMT